MTEMQKEMQKLISKDELDKAFDARFPKEMQVKLHNAKVAIAGLGGLLYSAYWKTKSSGTA